VSTLAGVAGKAGGDDGTGSNALFDGPYAMVHDRAGNLFVVDSKGGCVIRKIDRKGVVTTFAGKSGEPGATDGTSIDARYDGVGSDARFGNIIGITIDPAGNLYVIDEVTIRKISPAGKVTTLGDYSFPDRDPLGQGWSYGPTSIAADDIGNVYYTVNSRIRKINAQGDVIGEVDAVGDEHLGLGTLRTLAGPPALIFLESQTLALISNDAILKLMLP